MTESPTQNLDGKYDSKMSRFMPAAIFNTTFSQTYADLLKNFNAPGESRSDQSESEGYPSPRFRSKKKRNEGEVFGSPRGTGDSIDRRRTSDERPA